MIRKCVVLEFVATFVILTLAVHAQQAAKVPGAAADPSGMYSFLREGEFVQLTVEDGKVSGYVSRFGDTDSDKGQFIDQFFDTATLTSDRLSFKTKTVHGVWYDFSGVILVTQGKQPGQENYRVIKGTLLLHTSDANNPDKTSSRQVEFKSFPQDLSKP